MASNICRTLLEGAGQPLLCDLHRVEIDVTGKEVLDVVRQRQVWVRRTKKRLKRVVDVSYWRTGKPNHQIREEAIRRQGLTNVPFSAELKRNHRQPSKVLQVS